MNERTKACAISAATKDAVFKRDRGQCVLCGKPGLPEAHYIPRSKGGLGIEQNIVTLTDIHGDNKLGFVPKEADDDLCAGEAYYCNYGSTWSDGAINLPIFGGYRSDGARAGAFQLSCCFDASNAYSVIGARLCFCGKDE